jgi:capsular exopolysaccharide synthesis family protein
MVNANSPGSNQTQSWWLNFKIVLFRFGLVLKRLWWVPLLTVAIGLAGAGWFIARTPPSYLSSGRMMVSGKININEGSMYSEELLNFFGTQIELMQSGEVRNRALARVQALNPGIKPVKVQLSVGQQPKASLFVFQAIASDGAFAQKYLDACMEEYMSVKKQMRSDKSETTLSNLKDELDQTERELRKAEDKLLTFQKENNLGSLKEEGNSAAVYLAKLKFQLADLNNEYNLLERLDVDQNLERKAQVGEGGTSASESPLIAFGPAAEYVKCRQQLQVLEVERQQLGRVMRPKHPDMMRLDEEITRARGIIEGLRQQTAEQIKSRRAAIAIQMEHLNADIPTLEAKALELSGRIAEFTRIQNEVDRIKQERDRLFTSFRNVDVTKTVSQDMVSILERASPPVSVKPGVPKAIAIALAGGLLIGLGVLFLVDRLDDRVAAVLAVQQRFQEPILGQIIEEKHSGPLSLLTPDDKRHAFFESFRNLRSSLFFLPVEGERPKAFLITSCVPNEGKSTVSANLATVIAMSGAKTLLVDGDLRRGRLHRSFGLSNECGFSEVLKSEVNWSEAVQQTAIENLTLLPRGRSITQPGERLLGPVTDRFLREVYAAYDYVVIDSSPVLVADDTASLAPKVDAVLFVVRFGQSSIRLGERATDILKQRQANLLGLVLNGVNVDAPEYGYYEYSKYYQAVED